MSTYTISVPDEKIASLNQKLSQTTLPDEVGLHCLAGMLRILLINF